MNAIAIFNTNQIKGSVKFHQCDTHKMCFVTFDLKGFKPFKTHGIHIHRYGILSVENACDSTCEHYNPYNSYHGNIHKNGNDRHAGDLINNLNTNASGDFSYSYTDPLINVKDILGRSIVIHEGIDDLGIHRTDFSNPTLQKLSATTGNSGKRIACSVIGLGPN